MKILIVAHPDDEIIWFNAKQFDKIIIVFLGIKNDIEFTENRRKVLEEHPLKEKIVSLGFMESGYRRDRSVKLKKETDIQCRKLLKILPKLLKGVTEIYTHNPWGEFGHQDHELVSRAVYHLTHIYKTINVPVYCNLIGEFKKKYIGKIFELDMDVDFTRQVRDLYYKYNVWTGQVLYEQSKKQKYFKLKI